MSVSSSPQVARKSHKLESLPDDLRSEANKLIAKKFPPPKEAKKKYTPTNPDGFNALGLRNNERGIGSDDQLEHGNKLRNRVLEFPYFDSSLGISNVKEGTAFSIPKWNGKLCSTQDDETLNQVEHMPPDCRVELLIKFIPVGTFTNGLGLTMREFENRISMENLSVISHGNLTESARGRIELQLDALNKCYGGQFIYRIEKWDVRVVQPGFSSYVDKWNRI